MGCILLKMKGWRRGIGMRFHLMVLASSLEAVCASTAATSTRRLNIYAVVIGQEMNRSQSTIAALAELERAKAEGMKQGRMYQVRINANPDDFLDWDKAAKAGRVTALNRVSAFLLLTK